MYNPSDYTPYRAQLFALKTLLIKLTNLERQDITTYVIIGDINFQHTILEVMTKSMNECESTILEILGNSKFQQVLPCKNARNLDVLLRNRPHKSRTQSLTTTGTRFCIVRPPSIQNSPWSEHSFVPNYPKITTCLQSGLKFLNDYLTETSVKPYYYSNVDEQVQRWYNWVLEMIDSPRVIKHRSNQPLG